MDGWSLQEPSWRTSTDLAAERRRVGAAATTGSETRNKSEVQPAITEQADRDDRAVQVHLAAGKQPGCGKAGHGLPAKLGVDKVLPDAVQLQVGALISPNQIWLLRQAWPEKSCQPLWKPCTDYHKRSINRQHVKALWKYALGRFRCDSNNVRYWPRNSSLPARIRQVLLLLQHLWEVQGSVSRGQWWIAKAGNS